MALVVRGGKLLVGADGKLTTNDDCCCDDETCCTTHKVTSVSILLASGSDCCFDLVGTYFPDGSSGGCVYKFIETYNEPNPICDLITADDCFRRDGAPFGFSGIHWQWWLKKIEIEVQLDNVGGGPNNWSLLGTIEFYVSEFNANTLQCTEGVSTHVFIGTGAAHEDCATGVVDLTTVSTGSTLSNSLSIHPACDPTGMTFLVQIDPL